VTPMMIDVCPPSVPADPDFCGPPAPIAMVCTFPGVTEMPVQRPNAPAPPPPPAWFVVVCGPAPDAFPPHTSRVSIRLQSDGTVHVVPDVRTIWVMSGRYSQKMTRWRVQAFLSATVTGTTESAYVPVYYRTPWGAWRQVRRLKASRAPR